MASGMLDTEYANITTDNALRYNETITDHDISNPYYCPCDGYVLIQGVGTVSLYNTALSVSEQTQGFACMFVKKGCKIQNSNAPLVIFRAFW